MLRPYGLIRIATCVSLLPRYDNVLVNSQFSRLRWKTRSRWRTKSYDEEERLDTDSGEHDRRAEPVREEVDYPVRNDAETRHGQEIAQHAREGVAPLAVPEFGCR